MTPEQGFGEVIKELRHQRGMSQEALATRAGCSRQFISLLEGGKNSPSLTNVLYLAKALEVTSPELLQRLEQKLADATHGGSSQPADLSEPS